mgnify:FL=1
MRNTFSKEEKLKSRKQIALLFEKGDSIKQFPIRIKYLKLSDLGIPPKIAFSVPKRNFKLAVDRIRIKRLLRESYRKNKETLYHGLSGEYILMILFIDKMEWNQQDLHDKLSTGLQKLKDRLEADE